MGIRYYWRKDGGKGRSDGKVGKKT